MPHTLPSSRSSLLRASHFTNYFIVLVTVFNCSCSLLASYPSTIPQKPTILEQIRKNERHKIRVGTALMAPAFDIFMCYRNDELIGFDADVAHHLVQKLYKKEEEQLRQPLRIQFMIYEWNDLFKAVETGNVDFIIAGISPTPSRKKNYHLSFTNPYADDLRHVLIFQRKEDEPKFGDKTTFVSARGTTQQNLAEFLSRALGGRLALVETFADGVLAVIGHPDHILVGDEGLSRSMKDQSGLKLVKLDEKWFQEKQQDPEFDRELRAYQESANDANNRSSQSIAKGTNIWDNDLVIAVAQDQDGLLAILNKIIHEEHDHLKYLREFWFPRDPNPDPPPPKCGMQQIDGFLYVDEDRAK